MSSNVISQYRLHVYHTALTQFILQQMETFTVADKVQPVCTVPAVQTQLAQ